MAALVGEVGVAALFSGVLFGAVGAKLGGTSRMLYVAPGLALAAGLGSASAYDWEWVVLLAGVAFVAGAGIRFGWLPPLLMVPYAATFVTAASSAEDAVSWGVIVGLGAVYGILLARRFGAPKAVEGDRLEPPVAATVAVVFAAILGASAAIGVALSWTEPYWVPEPILILVLYILMGKRDRIRGKAIGTAVGVCAAIPVAILEPPSAMLTAIGIVAFVVALIEAKRYWLMYGLYTFSLIMLLAAPGQVGFEAAERGVQILVGVGLLVIGLFVVQALGGWLQRRDPQPELAATAGSSQAAPRPSSPGPLGT
jgi:hypothetical protein